MNLVEKVIKDGEKKNEEQKEVFLSCFCRFLYASDLFQFHFNLIFPYNNFQIKIPFPGY